MAGVDGSSNERPRRSPDQHPLALSVALHLGPGAALFAFVVVASAFGVPAVLALLAGMLS